MKVIKASYKIETPIDRVKIYTNLELCGRNAYKSEEKITEGSAEKFIAMIVKNGHESVLEHENLTIRFICDRGVTHEIVRHRLVAYTQESTRYCNYGGKDIVFIKPVFWNKDDPEYMVWTMAMEKAEYYYHCLTNDSYNCTPQEARSVLPNSLKTEIVCTTNIREWRHIMRLRTSKTAHPQMREIMVPLLKELREKLPILFNDVGDIS